MAAITANQMKISTNSTSRTVAPPRILGPGRAFPSLKNSCTAASAVIPSVPPTQIGLDTQ